MILCKDILLLCMRFLTADYLYPLNTEPVKEGVLQISDTGEVKRVFKSRELISKDKLEFFEGVLCPGFINAHCHLELSHLKGFSEEKSGFLNFIRTIENRYNFEQHKILDAIEHAELEMIKNGICGVGDICNTADTLFQKEKKNLQYYNFIEVFGVQNKLTNIMISHARKIREEFRQAGMQSTISPHSAYSVTPDLMSEILSHFDEKDDVFSVHMQETKEENSLFKHKKGSFYDWLTRLESTVDIWAKRDSSLDIINELSNKKILLVHNTFTSQDEITEQYYCTCPKSNLYIENSLPNYSIFPSEMLCVGTDSLASNNSLSILEELQIIKENSDFDLNTLLKIASKNGAEALGFKNLGTFEQGKTPGVNLISEFKEVKVIA